MDALQGKVVIITGAGQGLGEAYAKLAAAEGACVVVNDVDEGLVTNVAGRIAANGGRAVGIVGDVTDELEVTSLFDRAEAEFGPVDGIVCNAGILLVGPADQGTPDQIRRMIDVNITGTWLCGVEAIRRMQAQDGGSIVLVTSGVAMGIQESAAYGMTKGAVAALTTCWASDLEGSGIRVNAVSPFAGTRMAEEVLRSRAVDGRFDPQVLAAFPTAESNAPLVLYLLSDWSADVVGQLFRIEGDALSVISRPALLRPSAQLGTPTVEAVRGAISASLGDLMAPPGLLAFDEGVGVRVAKRHH
jgi:NAD(P)-dependent dehydrogenase (short-subunit alcohol dehydrogenase family)